MTALPSTEDLARLAKAITPGPWRRNTENTVCNQIDGEHHAICTDQFCYAPEEQQDANAEAIALLPALIREVLARREAVPVAWRYRDARNVKSKWTVQKNRPDWWKGDGPDGYVLEPLYAHPPQPSASVVEALRELVAACEAYPVNIPRADAALDNAHAALRALKGDA